MIDYNQPWQVMGIDISNALKPEINAEKFRAESTQANNPAAIWSYQGNEMTQFLIKDWLEYLRNLGIDVGSFLMFYRDAHYVHPEVHVDTFWHNQLPNVFGLNWVFSPNDDSFMTWYDLPFETGIQDVTITNTTYRYWHLDEVKDKEITRHTIGNKLTLIRTGIPHNIIVNEQPRWLISLRFKSISEITDWKSAVDYYNNTLKLIKS